MNLDRRQAGTLERVVESVGVVGERSGVQQDAVKPVVGSRADPIDEEAFVIALATVDGRAAGCR